MLKRLVAEERMSRVKELVATGDRAMDDNAREAFMGELTDDIRGAEPGHLATKEEMLAAGVIIVEEK